LGRKNPVREMTETFQQVWVEKILAFAEPQQIAKDVVPAMKDALTENPSKKKVISIVKLCIICLLVGSLHNTYITYIID